MAEEYPLTQPFDVGNYETLGDESAENIVQNDVILSATQQFDVSNYEDVGGEEIIETEDSGSAVGELAVDEIASPEPENEEEILEENEDDEEHVVQPRRVNRISSDDDKEEDQRRELEDEGEGPSNRNKPRVYLEDDDDANEPGEREGDNSDTEKKSEVGELIANIFGESDDDEERQEAAAESDVDEASTGQEAKQKIRAGASDSDKESDPDDLKIISQPDFVSDFDLMMERRRAENRRRYRKRKDYDIINDSDDVINRLIAEMKHATKADLDFNRLQKPALSKRKLLPTVVKQLKKSDLQSAFIELGVVSVIADWLSPLPDGSLPALEIRTELLKVLQQFPTLDHQILKSSGIGKAVMILFKHPKEIKENKDRASKLINEWARPIFSLQSDYRSLSKEERIQRDYDHMPLAKKRRMESTDAENKPKSDTVEDEESQLRPGDKGWIGRARVPQPSTKDYVVRPKWNIDAEFRKNASKKSTSMMERKLREIRERTKPKKAMRAVGVSIEGKKMM